MTDNTIIITRTLDANEMQRLLNSLHDIWPGQEWSIMHGTMLRGLDDLRAAWGPGEFKDATATPLPRWE